jgi:hypothetical protein
MNATVLVVEDEVLIRVATCDELRARGYVVIEAVNADEAPSVLRSPVQVKLTTVNIYAQSQRLVVLQFRADGHESGHGGFSPRPLMIAQSETEAILGDEVRQRGGITLLSGPRNWLD